MFYQGARISSDKISPYAMLEELQSLYPGHYALPGENEIHAEITPSRLVGRRPVMRTMEVVIMMRVKMKLKKEEEAIYQSSKTP